jgi:hypothetical protein
MGIQRTLTALSLSGPNALSPHGCKAAGLKNKHIDVRFQPNHLSYKVKFVPQKRHFGIP